MNIAKLMKSFYSSYDTLEELVQVLDISMLSKISSEGHRILFKLVRQVIETKKDSFNLCQVLYLLLSGQLKD